MSMPTNPAEPVGRVRKNPDDYGVCVDWIGPAPEAGTELYAAPQAKPAEAVACISYYEWGRLLAGESAAIYPPGRDEQARKLYAAPQPAEVPYELSEAETRALGRAMLRSVKFVAASPQPAEVPHETNQGHETERLASSPEAAGAFGTTHCPICGYDQPHGHDERALRIEREIRPTFEKLFLERSFWRSSVKNLGNGWGSAPGRIVNAAGFVGYPAAFGWNGVERAKTFGGSIAYDDSHWSYRKSVAAPYANAAVEAIWQLFLDIAETQRSSQPSGSDEKKESGAQPAEVPALTDEQIHAKAEQLGVYLRGLGLWGFSPKAFDDFCAWFRAALAPQLALATPPEPAAWIETDMLEILQRDGPDTICSAYATETGGLDKPGPRTPVYVGAPNLANGSWATNWLTNGAELHPLTANLVVRFARALAQKLATAEKKYGFTDGWRDTGWMDDCRARLKAHMAKGDPRDVAAYCAFLWHHGESTVK